MMQYGASRSVGPGSSRRMATCGTPNTLSKLVTPFSRSTSRIPAVKCLDNPPSRQSAVEDGMRRLPPHRHSARTSLPIFHSNPNFVTQGVTLQPGCPPAHQCPRNLGHFTCMLYSSGEKSVGFGNGRRRRLFPYRTLREAAAKTKAAYCKNRGWNNASATPVAGGGLLLWCWCWCWCRS